MYIAYLLHVNYNSIKLFQNRERITLGTLIGREYRVGWSGSVPIIYCHVCNKRPQNVVAYHSNHFIICHNFVAQEFSLAQLSDAHGTDLVVFGLGCSAFSKLVSLTYLAP